MAGRRPEGLREVAATIAGRTEIAQVDALDPAAVDSDVVDRHGRLDVSITNVTCGELLD